MIHEEQDLDGNTRGRIVCGNAACGRILRVYEGCENSPGPNSASYLLLEIQTRLFFVDGQGRPVPVRPGMQDLADLLFQLDGQAVGYTVVPGTHAYREDFCSSQCASQFIADNPKWGLCVFRPERSSMVTFVAQRPERFSTKTVQIPLQGAGETPMERHHAAIIPCLGLRLHPRGPCNTLIGIALDIGPSAWRCPVCSTVYIVDPIEQGGCADLGSAEIQGHKVEILPAEKARAIRDDSWEFNSFYSLKVGSPKKVFVAEVYSEPGAGLDLLRR
jgi:hypothetical protein